MLGYLALRYLVVCLLFIGFAKVVGQSESQQLEDYFVKKCSRHSGDGAVPEKLRGDIYEFVNYLNLVFEKLPRNKESFCKEKRSELKTRIETIADDLKPCLSTEERFFPSFVRDGFKEFLHFLCHNNGDNINRYFSPSAQQCREKMASEGSENEVLACLEGIIAPDRGTIKKTQICGDMGVMKNCFAQTYTKHCPGTNSDYVRLNEELYKYITKPCNGCITSYLSYIVLLATLLLHVLPKF